MRIGLNTGIVVVGDIGSDLHMEYLAIGDTVNLAARMQSAADPDTILISENTYRHVASLFDFEDRGKIAVKGKAEAVQVYAVVRGRKGAARQRGITGLSSPMVGRRREFATLMQVFGDLQMGKGGIVTISGEAGLGKSRLLAEWRKARTGEPSAAVLLRGLVFPTEGGNPTTAWDAKAPPRRRPFAGSKATACRTALRWPIISASICCARAGRRAGRVRGGTARSPAPGCGESVRRRGKCEAGLRVPGPYPGPEAGGRRSRPRQIPGWPRRCKPATSLRSRHT